MNTPNSIKVSLQEGPPINYYKALYEEFGGSFDNEHYKVDSGALKAKIQSFNQLPGVEIMLFELITRKEIILARTPDNNPQYLHLNIISEGAYNQFYEQESQAMRSGSTKGVFLYNGLFPISVTMPLNTETKILGFKIDLTQTDTFFKDTFSVLQSLFENETEGLAYHTPVSHEIDRLIDDFIYYNNFNRGRLPLVLSRGMEIFTNLGLSLDKLKDDDELNGLHIEDFERINKIKQKLLSSFDQKITIDEIADDHGVSVSKLKRDFKSLLGSSIYQFYTNAKMDEAHRRLKSGNYTVSEVGYDLGYSNLSKFSEMFKKTKGISPKYILKSQE